MLQTDLSKPETLGADLRALRKSRGLTLSDMAESLGRSVGWLSQVERDLSNPSISDLREIAALLGVPISMLFRHAAAPRTRRVTLCAMVHAVQWDRIPLAWSKNCCHPT